MMRTYGKVKTTFWGWSERHGLSRDARDLALYLIACPHSNAAGCFELRNGYIMMDVFPHGLADPSRSIDDLFDDLPDDFAVRCRKTQFVFIPKALEHDTPKNVNSWKGVISAVQLLPASFTYRAMVMAALRKYADRSELIANFVGTARSSVGSTAGSTNDDMLDEPVEPEPEITTGSTTGLTTTEPVVEPPIPFLTEPNLTDKGDCAATRVHAHDATLDVPWSLSRSPKTDDLIAAFVAARYEAHGVHPPHPPNLAADQLAAERIAAGGGEARDVWAVVLSREKRRAAESRPPTATLSYFDQPIADHVASRNRPIAVGNPNAADASHSPARPGGKRRDTRSTADRVAAATDLYARQQAAFGAGTDDGRSGGQGAGWVPSPGESSGLAGGPDHDPAEPRLHPGHRRAAG